MNPRHLASLGLIAVGGIAVAVLWMLSSSEGGAGETGSGPSLGRPESELAEGGPQQRAAAPAPGPQEATSAPLGAADGGRTAALAPSAPTTGSGVLTGEVRSPEGDPLAGAVVELTRSDIAPSLEGLEAVFGADDYPVYEGRTDSSGRYRFEGLIPASNYRVQAQHSSYAPSSHGGLSVSADAVTQRDLELRPGHSIEGMVTDMVRVPIEGARVTLMSQAASDLPLTRTPRGARFAYSDEQGVFQFIGVAEGVYAVRVDLEGYATMIRGHVQVRAPKRGERARSMRVPFRLEPEHVLRGRVVDQDGRGLAGAVVEGRFDRPALSNRGYAMTDAQGQFEMRGLAPVELALSVRLEGYLNHSESEVPVDGDGHEVVLLQLGRAAGFARSAATESPLPRFRARLRSWLSGEQALGGVVQEREFESDQGYFQFQGLPAGLFVVEVLAPGHAPAISEPFQSGPGMAFGEADVLAPIGARLTGRVVDGATRAPVEGVVVRTLDPGRGLSPLAALGLDTQVRETTDARARTDAEGRFELDGMAGGTYRLLLLHDDYSDGAVDGVRVLTGEELELGDVVVHAGATLTGTVRDHLGQPIARAEVQLLGVASAAAGSVGGQFRTQSDAQGRFHLHNLPAGSFRLSATPPSNGAGGLDALLLGAQNDVAVTLSVGGQFERDLFLRLE